MRSIKLTLFALFILSVFAFAITPSYKIITPDNVMSVIHENNELMKTNNCDIKYYLYENHIRNYGNSLQVCNGLTTNSNTIPRSKQYKAISTQ